MDHKGNTVVPEGYEEIEVWNKEYIAFRQKGQWGIVNQKGQLLVKPAYDEVILEVGRYFIVRRGEFLGLVSLAGNLILDCKSIEVKSFNEDLIFYRQNEKWGAVNSKGKVLLKPLYDLYSKLSDSFIKLKIEQENYLFSTVSSKIIAKSHDDYFAFSAETSAYQEAVQNGLDGCRWKDSFS